MCIMRSRTAAADTRTGDTTMTDYCTQPATPAMRTTATVAQVAAELARDAFGFTIELVSDRVAFLCDSHRRTVRLWDNGGEMGANFVNLDALPVFAPTRFSDETYAAQYGAPVVVAYRLVSQLNDSDTNTVWEETAASLADAL